MGRGRRTWMGRRVLLAGLAALALAGATVAVLAGASTGAGAVGPVVSVPPHVNGPPDGLNPNGPDEHDLHGITDHGGDLQPWPDADDAPHGHHPAPPATEPPDEPPPAEAPPVSVVRAAPAPVAEAPVEPPAPPSAEVLAVELDGPAGAPVTIAPPVTVVAEPLAEQAPVVEVLDVTQVRPVVEEVALPLPEDDPPPSPSRSTFASGLTTDIDLSPAWVAGNAGLGGLLLLAVLAAAQLFNDALKTHHDELVRQLGDRSTVLGRGRLALTALPHPPVLVTFATVAAVLGLLADPRVTFSTNTLAQMVGMTIAVGATAAIYDGTASRLVSREAGVDRRFRLYPLAIAVAVICLAVSRVLGVAPGVLYGLFVGVAFAGAVEGRLLGRAYARSSAYLLGAAMAAFGVHVLVAPAAEGAAPGFWAIVVDAAAAALVVGGLQAVIVQLLPTRFVNGEHIAAWSRVGWFSLLALAIGLYMVVVVRPNPDQQSWGNLWFVAGLVMVAVVFWIWANLHHRKVLREAADQPPPADEELVGT